MGSLGVSPRKKLELVVFRCILVQFKLIFGIATLANCYYYQWHSQGTYKPSPQEKSCRDEVLHGGSGGSPRRKIENW